MSTLVKITTSPLCILCMLIPQIIPLLTLKLVHTWYEESTPGLKTVLTTRITINTYACMCHNIYSTMWVGSWPWNMSIILCGHLEQIENIYLLFIHSCYTPNTIHMNICVHPHKNSLESLFIATLSLKIRTTFTIILLLKLPLFIIRTFGNFFLFSKFLPMNVR